jgi:hypothetical protein
MNRTEHRNGAAPHTVSIRLITMPRHHPSRVSLLPEGSSVRLPATGAMPPDDRRSDRRRTENRRVSSRWQELPARARHPRRHRHRRPPPVQHDGLAVASLICAFFIPPPGIVFGHVSRHVAKQAHRAKPGIAWAS